MGQRKPPGIWGAMIRARIFRVPGDRLPSDLSHLFVGGLALCLTQVGS